MSYILEAFGWFLLIANVLFTIFMIGLSLWEIIVEDIHR